MAKVTLEIVDTPDGAVHMQMKMDPEIDPDPKKMTQAQYLGALIARSSQDGSLAKLDSNVEYVPGLIKKETMQ